MKKEIFAGALLAAILAAVVINASCIQSVTDSVAQTALTAGENARKGEWQEAEKAAREAIGIWERSGAYTHIVLRHSDIDTAAHDLYALLQEIMEENEEGAAASAEAAAEDLYSVAKMESIRLGSIF